jgi:hypothetical protein
MNKRDFFAGIAMHALLLTEWDENTTWPCNIDPFTDDPEETQTDAMARAAYIYADAMLRERKSNG